MFRHISVYLQHEIIRGAHSPYKSGGRLVVNVESPWDIPKLAEERILTFGSEGRLRICMSLQGLGKSGLEGLGKK